MPSAMIIHKDIADAEIDGRTFFSGFRKLPVQTTAANIWFDLSMSPGNPVPNYYIGASGKFIPLAQSTDGGIPHGGNVSPKQKILRVLEVQTALATAAPLPLWLLDYLGFYPFIDESVTTEQSMDNSIQPTRALNAKDVQIMPVVVAGQTGGGTFTVKYTNQNGVAGRMTPPHVMSTQSVNGTIITSGRSVANSRAPFMALQEGDTGVQKIESITFGGLGDIGLLTLVLVRLIAKHQLRGIGAPVEQDFYIDSNIMPVIEDDAYLNFICCPAGTLSGSALMGYIKTAQIGE